MSVLHRLRGRADGQDRVDPQALVDRVEALRRFVRVAGPYLADSAEADRLEVVRVVTGRAAERLELSRDHTVVALAGATGSGKSSIFNGLARLDLSRVGVRRPTTGTAHACVWGAEQAKPLLDWLDVPPGQRFNRESPLDGDDEAPLRGLVLLDLPDFDSVQEAHRDEVDRLLDLVDLVVWVLDPQKYADRVVHEQYLSQFSQHADITVVVLNQADRLCPVDATRCLDDLRRLLAADGLPDVPVLATSATSPGGLDGLRELLEEAVTARQAALRRLAGDVSAAAAGLTVLVETEVAEDAVDRTSVRRLAEALAHSAGVPAVTEAAERAYRHRAARSTGWPLARWVRRVRPDPLRRLHLGERAATGTSSDTDDPTTPVPVTSLPVPSPATAATAALAVRTVAGSAAQRLPEPWPAAVVAAARSRLDDLPDALDRAVAGTDLGLDRKPLWWRAVGLLQWLVTLTALVGLVWLGVRYAMFALALPEFDTPKVGLVPLPTALLAGGLLAGLLIAVLVRPLIGIGARRAHDRADTRLRAAVTEVARELVVVPVREVLHGYADARAALATARVPLPRGRS